MDWWPGADEANVRLLVQRGLGAVYLVAFLVALNQFRGLLGQRGLTPVSRYVERVPFRDAPSLFHLNSSDRAIAAVCWVGLALSLTTVSGLVDTTPIPVTMAVWVTLWVLYQSIVNVGQIWYGFGWESLLLEAGFLAIFLGPADTEVPAVILVLFWWLLFRVEFGAGLIKMRGDLCWRNLTCLEYHHETQPMPNPLSRSFHHMAKPLHRVEVAANHFAQLVAPFLLFSPQPIRSVAAVLMIITQAYLMLSGNFAWLNLLTIVLGVAALDGGLLDALGWSPTGELDSAPLWFEMVTYVVAAGIVVLSWKPVQNLMSKQQRMNASFDRLHLVNTYGAFGSINRHRDEIIIEGTADPDPGTDRKWSEYGFKGKPGDPMRRSRQWAPYHLRLDWLMWFIPLSPRYAQPWFPTFVTRLLENDPAVVRLLGHNPFPEVPPIAIRARRFRYRYTTRAEQRETGARWTRNPMGEFLLPTTLEGPSTGPIPRVG